MQEQVVEGEVEPQLYLHHDPELHLHLQLPAKGSKWNSTSKEAQTSTNSNRRASVRLVKQAEKFTEEAANKLEKLHKLDNLQDKSNKNRREANETMEFKKKSQPKTDICRAG